MLELQLKSEFLIAKQFSHDRDFNSAHVQGFHLQLFQQYMMVQDMSDSYKVVSYNSENMLSSGILHPIDQLRAARC